MPWGKIVPHNQGQGRPPFKKTKYLWVFCVSTCLVQNSLQIFQKLHTETIKKHFPNSMLGLRKGDPLSPYVFIILVEVMRRNLKALAGSGMIKGIKTNTSSPLQVIQQFIDDTFMFDQYSIHEGRSWKTLLNQYERVLGQCINYQKKCISLTQKRT